MSFKDEFRQRLKENGITQKYISDIMHIPYSTIRKWACGLHEPGLAIILAIREEFPTAQERKYKQAKEDKLKLRGVGKHSCVCKYCGEKIDGG